MHRFKASGYRYAFSLVLFALILQPLLFCTPAFAVREYYSISRSVRALGMGGAFYGLSDDEYALFYNPAGLSRYRGGTEFMIQIRADASTKLGSALSTVTKLSGKSTTDTVDSLLQFQGTPLYANAGVMFPFFARKHFALSLLLADAKLDFSLLGRGLDSFVDLTVISDSGLVMGYGDSFFTPNLHLGVNMKGLVRAGGKQTYSILDIVQGTKIQIDPNQIGGIGGVVDFDLGATYAFSNTFLGGKHSLSAVMSNLVGNPKTSFNIKGNSPPGLPRMFTLAGHTEFPGYGIIDRVNVLLDLAEFGIGGQPEAAYGGRVGSVWKHVNFGAELPLLGGWFSVRTGLHQGNVTAGIGINARFFKLDLATYAEELNDLPGRLTSRRVALRLALGPAGSAPKPVPSTGTKGFDIPPETDEKERIEEIREGGGGEKAGEKNPEAPPVPEAQTAAPAGGADGFQVPPQSGPVQTTPATETVSPNGPGTTAAPEPAPVAKPVSPAPAKPREPQTSPNRSPAKKKGRSRNGGNDRFNLD